MATTSPPYNIVSIADCVLRFRAARPHVHCITNGVAQNFTANVLLAAGATPSMTIAPEEVQAFVEMADALLINLGTMDTERSKAVEIAVTQANHEGKPWALDPVFVQGSPLRLTLARSLVDLGPVVVRCNKGEEQALFEGRDAPCILARTGAVDRVVHEGRTVSIENGSPVMDRITAMGCALTALVAGFTAVEDDAFLAVTAALVLFGLAGDHAAETASGPGTFVPRFLDALHNIDSNDIKTGARMK